MSNGKIQPGRVKHPGLKRISLACGLIFGILLVGWTVWYVFRSDSSLDPGDGSVAELGWVEIHGYALDEWKWDHEFEGGIKTRSAGTHPIRGTVTITRQGERSLKKAIDRFNRLSPLVWSWLIYAPLGKSSFDVTAEIIFRDEKGQEHAMKTETKTFRYVSREENEARRKAQNVGKGKS